MRISIPYLTYALNEIIKGRPTLKYLKGLEESQWYSKEKIQELQFDRLKNITTHAYNNTEYYKEAFDKAGFNPKSMNSFEDFKKAPFLAKSDIRHNPDKFIAKDRRRRLIKRSTSGSTGAPLTFYLCADRIAADKAAHLRSRSWWNISIGDREAVLWGRGRDIATYSMIKRLRDRCLYTRLLSAFNMTEGSMLQYMEFLKKYKPKHIFGYAHSVYLLAYYAKKKKIALDNNSVKVVFVTADILHDFQRKTIEEAFGCPVANGYGGRDGGFIAHECPHGNMHVTQDIVYLECVNDKKIVNEGEKGELTVTHFYSYGMPFIRYKIEDEGMLADNSKCACGRNFSILEKILGRNTDYIVTPEGGFVHSLALMYIFREISSIIYFKIIQQREDVFDVFIVKDKTYTLDTEEGIKKQMMKVLGALLKIRFNYLTIDQIPKEDKHRYIESKIIGKYLG